MTFARARAAARAGRHLPATASSRLAAVAGASAAGSSENGLPRPMASAQHTAQALIGAEQSLAHAESRYLEARADVNAETRMSVFAETSGLADAERRLAVAEESRRRARERVEQLRGRLQDERRSQLPAAPSSPSAAARGASQGGSGQSLFARLLKR